MPIHINAGSLKGRKIAFKYQTKPRPTLGVVRKALFNIIGDEIRGSSFLDMFAGSGAVGIEALSHGAVYAAFIEADRLLYESLADNTRRLSLENRCEVYFGHYKKHLTTLRRLRKVFNVIYIDPPYYKTTAIDAVSLAIKNKLLAPAGQIIIERHKDDRGLGSELASRCGLVECDSRLYGMTELEFFRAAIQPEQEL